MDAIKLVIPDEAMAAEAMAYRQELLDAGSSMDGCGPLRRMADPAEWLAFNRMLESLPLGQGEDCRLTRSTQFAGVRAGDGRLVGMLQVRHEFNAFLREYAGHIGYSVRPSERRKGYATQMLRQALPFCREIGLDRVLVCCLRGNEASRRTILRCGGVYEKTVFEPERQAHLERYWIDLP